MNENIHYVSTSIPYVNSSYLTVDGRKIGKSNGNGIDPFGIVERYDTDALRWYLLRHVRFTEDADFSEERLVASHDGELADQLGNLVNRTLSVLCKKGGGVPAHPGGHTDFWHEGQRLRKRIDDAIGSFAIHEAAAAVYGYVGAANRYIVESAPWSLIKRTDDLAAIAEAKRTLSELFDAFRIVAYALTPLLPVTSIRLRKVVERAVVGNAEPAILFPKLGVSLSRGQR